MIPVFVAGGTKDYQAKIFKIFKRVKVACEGSATFEAALEQIPNKQPLLIITQKQERAEPLHALRAILKTHCPASSIIVTLPRGGMDAALEAMQAGAYDCLSEPIAPIEMLMASRRAALKQGRMLFATKIRRKKPNRIRLWSLCALSIFLTGFIVSLRKAIPQPEISLGSATLSGLQWDGPNLWVGDWFESTITHYRVRSAFMKKNRVLETKEIFKLKESQPILICQSKDSLATISTDLNLRTHQRSTTLPSYQTRPTPGTNPTGLVWDGKNFWSSDGITNLLYRHGNDLGVLSTVKSIVPHVVGLAWDGEAFWVLGGKDSLQLANFRMVNGAPLWRGPFNMRSLLPENVIPSGFSVQFGSVWLISGGDPRMISHEIPIDKDLMKLNNQQKIEKGKS